LLTKKERLPPAKVEKRVISFGLYGANDKYIIGAYRNAELTPSVFPGWVMRVYHDNSVPQASLDKLSSMGVELVKMKGGEGAIAGMFWRFLVADDISVDRYIIRDTDSRLNEREARAVDAWIESGKAYHVLRDHPSHSAAAISGGLWGGTRDAEMKMAQRMASHPKHDYIQDMSFLASSVYPFILDRMIAHDAFSCTACKAGCRGHGQWPNSVAFPTPRIAFYHCGQVFDSNDTPRQGDIDLLKQAFPPSECTPRFPHIAY